jgi:virginiamycin B lyase
VVALGASLGLAVAASATVALALPQPHVAARISTGSNPCEAAAAAGALWVANDGSGTLARVDPRTNRVTARVRVGRGSCAVAAGAGGVWVANYRTGLVLRVDPRTRKVRRVFVGGSPFDLVVAAGGVWVTGFENGTLVRVEPRTLRVVRRIRLGGAPNGLVYAAGSLWVGLGRGATQVLRVDPASGSVRRIEVGVAAPTHFASTSAGIWVANDGDALALLDPGDGRVSKVVHLGRTLAQPALAPDGTLWVPDKEIDRVFRVDPWSGRVVGSFPGGDGAFLALRAFGSMWVTSYAGADVWRYATAKKS